MATSRFFERFTRRVCWVCLQGTEWTIDGRTRILVQVTIYRRLLIGRDGHLDQSEANDIL